MCVGNAAGNEGFNTAYCIQQDRKVHRALTLKWTF